MSTGGFGIPMQMETRGPQRRVRGTSVEGRNMTEERENKDGGRTRRGENSGTENAVSPRRARTATQPLYIVHFNCEYARARSNTVPV